MFGYAKALVSIVSYPSPKIANAQFLPIISVQRVLEENSVRNCHVCELRGFTFRKGSDAMDGDRLY